MVVDPKVCDFSWEIYFLFMEKECWVRHCNSFLKFQTISNRCFCYFYRLIWHALRKFNRLIPYSIGWSITFFKEIKMLFHSIGRKLSFSCSMREIQQKTNCFLKWKPKIEYNAVILNSSNVFMLPQLDRTKLWWKFFLIQFLLMFFFVLFCSLLYNSNVCSRWKNCAMKAIQHNFSFILFNYE